MSVCEKCGGAMLSERPHNHGGEKFPVNPNDAFTRLATYIKTEPGADKTAMGEAILEGLADRALLLAEVERLTEYGRVQEMRGTMAEAYADGVDRENAALRALCGRAAEVLDSLRRVHYESLNAEDDALLAELRDAAK